MIANFIKHPNIICIFQDNFILSTTNINIDRGSLRCVLFLYFKTNDEECIGYAFHSSSLNRCAVFYIELPRPSLGGWETYGRFQLGWNDAEDVEIDISGNGKSPWQCNVKNMNFVGILLDHFFLSVFANFACLYSHSW